MFIVTRIPWVSVSGFGAHIKSTRQNLIIQKKGSVEEYPLESIKHLLIVGGHSITSVAINQLVQQGAFISFFEPDGTPVGTIRPFSDPEQLNLISHQHEIPRQRLAVAIAQAALKSRLIAIQHAEEERNVRFYYEGEVELMHKSFEEMAYLIKLNEIRRLHRLTTDMYYEIMARGLPKELGFRRRTLRPQLDPVNAMLSFGYAMLYGTCFVSVIGSGLDPDRGFLHDGKGSLVQDLIEPLKSVMVDAMVFGLVQEKFHPHDFEITQDRCLLSDYLMKKMIGAFYTSINTEKVQDQVAGMLTAISDGEEFTVLY